MKKISFFIVGLSLSLLTLPSSAALPPLYQNAKDLDVMVEFVQKHPEVLQQLRRIDLEKKQVLFSKRCVAYFHRAPQVRPQGWVGPAAPLVYHKSNCTIDLQLDTPDPHIENKTAPSE